MKKRQVMARLFALCLSTAMISGNTISAVAAVPDNGANKNTTVEAADNKDEKDAKASAADAGKTVEDRGTVFDKITANLVVDSNKGSVSGSTSITLKNQALSSEKTATLPDVEPKDGYKFAGWKVTGTKVTSGLGEIKSAKVNGNVLTVSTSDVLQLNGVVTVEALFEAKPVTANFNVDLEKGSIEWNSEKDTFTENIADPSQAFTLPKVTAKEGWVFTGWTVSGKDGAATIGAEVTTFVPGDVAVFGATEGTVSLTAQFEKKATPVKKQVIVNFNTGDNGTFADGTIRQEKKVLEDESCAIPEVTAKEGWKFTGWKVEGKDGAEPIGAEVTTFVPGEVAFFYQGTGNVTLTAQYEEVPVAEKTVNVYFTLNQNMGEFTENPAAQGLSYENLTEDKIALPKVTAKEGYVFKGWKGTGKEDIILDAEAIELDGLKDIANFLDGSNNGMIALEAQFEAKPVAEEKTVNVYFSLNQEMGEFAENPAAESLSYENLTEDKLALPKVTAKEGYVFKGWKGTGKEDIILDAGTTELGGLKDLANFAGSNNGTISLEAQFEAVPEAEEKTVNVYFSLNQEMGEFAENPEAGSLSYENLTEDKLDLPKVEAKEGYVFKGWKGTGKDEIILDAEAIELGGLKDLANFAGSNNGTISLEAQFEAVPEAEEKTVNVYFSLNQEMGEFAENPEAGSLSYENLTEDKLDLPKVEAKEGYVFKGWKGTGKDDIILDAEAIELGGLKDLANFVDGSNNGFIALEAQFEAEPEAEEKTVNVYFSLNQEMGEFAENPEAQTVSYENLTEDKLAVPEVTAKEGYVFKGWKGTGKDEIILDAEATELGGLKDLANFAGSNNGTISLEAQFEAEPVAEEKTVNVYFSLNQDMGEFAENPEAQTVSYENLTEDKLAIPEVKAKDGYVFKGWKGTGKDEIILDAEATELGGLKDLANFAGSNNGTISLEAQFEAVPEAEERTVNVYFNVDGEKGHFTDPEGAEVVTYENIAEDSAEQFNIPKVAAKEGYVFTGWKGQGADAIEWGADAETFGVTGLAHFAEGSNVGYITLEAQFEEVPAVERTVNVYFNVDAEKGYFTDPEGAETVSFENIAADSAEQFNIPKVAAKEGYVFKGWKGQGADVIEWGADAETFGVTGLAHFEEGSNVGYATLEAVFEEEPVEEKTVNVYFNVDAEKGYFTDPEGAETVSFENIAADSAEQFLVPKVAAKEGYVFKGWKGQGADVIEWGADAETFGVTGLAHFPEGSNVGYATLEAVFEEEPVEEKTVNVYFNVDPEKGYFTDPEGAEVVSFENLPADSAEQFLVPKVAAKDGYVFKGWKGQGADVIEWGADAETFGVTGLAHFEDGSNVGYATIEAVFEEAPVEEKTVNVYFNVDPEKGYFTDPEGAEVVSFENLPADSAEQFLVPKVAAKEGYVFTGWKGQGADEILWDANASTFGVTGLAHFAEGSNVGYATLEAQFEEIPEELYPASADIVIDLEKGYFEGWEGVEVLENENLQESDYTLGFLPEVKVNDGYKWTGWKVTNEAGSEIYVLDTAATSIAFPYGVGDHYIVRATFEEVVPENPENPDKPDPENPDKPNPENPDKPNPENPDKPGTKPEKPDTKPEKPSTKPEKPSTKPNTEAKKPDKTNGVKTGDATNAGVFAAGLLGSALVVSGIAFKKKSPKK